MKKIKILLIVFLTLCFVNNIQAQSHNSNIPNSGCKYANNGKNYAKEGFIACNACRNDEEKKRIAKEAEDKRKYELDKAKNKALQEANQKAFDENQKKKQEEIKGGQSGEVLINGSSDNSKTQTISNTTAKPLDNYDPNTGLYTNPMTNTDSGSSTLDNYNKGTQQGQQITDIATGIADLFTPSPEELKRRAAETAEKERFESVLKTIREKNINKYLQGAKNGNELARMILYSGYSYYSSAGHDYAYMLPDREKWLQTAFDKKDLNAMCFVGRYIFATDAYLQSNIPFGIKSKNEAYKILEEAANLGSVDAMVFLAGYYNLNGKQFGNDAIKALYWYTKAAESGSPNAMYALGNIYRYRTAKPGSFYVKYKVDKNEVTAFNWFLKSIANPDYEESLFQKSDRRGSHFESYAYMELYYMYKGGIGCTKDKEMAELFYTKYKGNWFPLDPFEENMNKYVGTYKGKNVTAKIYIRNTYLFLFIENQPEYQLDYYGTPRYQIKQLPGYSVQFLKDANNKINELEFIQPDGRFKAIRVE